MGLLVIEEVPLPHHERATSNGNKPQKDNCIPDPDCFSNPHFGAIIYFTGDNRKEAFSLIVILSVFYLFNLLFLLFETLFKYYSDFFKYLIVVSDIVLSSLIIYFTGGRASPFIFLFPLILLFSGILIARWASYVSLVLCIFLYLFIIIVQF